MTKAEKWERFQRKFFFPSHQDGEGRWVDGHHPIGPVTYTAFVRLVERLPDAVLEELLAVKYLECYVNPRPARGCGESRVIAIRAGDWKDHYVIEVALAGELEDGLQEVADHNVASLFAKVHFGEFWQNDEYVLVTETKELIREQALTEWGYVKPENVGKLDER